MKLIENICSMKVASFILFFLCFLQIQAQELNIDVKVSTPNIQLADPRIFADMEINISEFLNNTKWTDDDYEDLEKIEGSLLITIVEELSTTSFKADFIFQSIRPVYNSNYKSQLLNYSDKNVPLSYVERQPIRKSTDTYFDNLSSVLTFYACAILGFDYDSFSPFGGEQYFQLAQNVLNTIPDHVRGADDNWSLQGKSRNRFYMIENLLNPRIKPLRQAMYEYHRLSLDTMADDADKAKAIMSSAITSISQVNKDLPNSMLVQMFTDCKRKEIIEIFKGANRGEQTKIYDLMVVLDPSQASEYSSIK